jgi:hypothetical protein
MKLLLAPINKLQEKQKQNKKKVYKPKMVFCLGNHEDRFDRLANDNPELSLKEILEEKDAGLILRSYKPKK